jgi:hypothetical protein
MKIKFEVYQRVKNHEWFYQEVFFTKQKAEDFIKNNLLIDNRLQFKIEEIYFDN